MLPVSSGGYKLRDMCICVYIYICICIYLHMYVCGVYVCIYTYISAYTCYLPAAVAKCGARCFNVCVYLSVYVSTHCTLLQATNSCPVCRYEIETDDAEYEAKKLAKAPPSASRYTHASFAES